jgi:hypothetical protein
MTETQETLVTERMRETRGVWTPPMTSPPVSASDIRKWAIATYWPEQPPRIYWDEEYAKTTRWGGIVAPRDFNPFAWPIDRPQSMDPWLIDAVLPYPTPWQEQSTTATAGSRGMNGGQTDTHGVRIRPGDVITFTSALVDWKQRDTRLGPTLFTYTEHRWTNQHGELVKQRINTLIRY